MIKIVDDTNFEKEVLNSEKPVIVDFYAEWCGPCKRLSPLLDEISGEKIAEKADFAKLNIDNSAELAATYGVMSVPTMILFSNGGVQARMVGLHAKEEIIKMIENEL
jgi:thioredoxin 1